MASIAAGTCWVSTSSWAADGPVIQSRYAAARSGFLVLAETCIGKLVAPMLTISPLSPGGMLKKIASSPSPSRAVAACQLPAISSAPVPLPNATPASVSLRALYASAFPR